MAIYTVHMKDNDTQGAVFIKEGFSWGAFALGPIWLLSKKLWLALFGFVVLTIIIGLVGIKFGVHPAALSTISLLMSFLLGAEATNLQRWKMSRQKFAPVAVVQGTKQDDAERRFFDDLVEASLSPWAQVKELY
jgi:Protein of unknown function (DUF2628)